MSNIPDLPQIPGVPDQLIRSINDRLRMVPSGKPAPAPRTIVQTRTIERSPGSALPPPNAPNLTAATAEAYYCDADGNETAAGRYFGLKGTATLPVGNPRYPHLRRIRLMLTDPAPSARRQDVLAIPASDFSGDVINWKTGFWPRPVSDATFQKLEFECENDDGKTTASPYAIDDITVLGIGSVDVPDVALFRAGRSLGDSTFAPEMYTDELRTKMLIDWAAVLPEDLAGWAGLAVWIKTAGGVYVQATGVADRSQFRLSEDNTYYVYDTIALAPENIPHPPETWTFIAVSYNHAGEPNRDEFGNPRGPEVQLQTLPKSDHVLNFDAVLVQGWDENGGQTFGYHCTWDTPAIPRYRAIRIIELDYFGPDEQRQMTGDMALWDTEASIGMYPTPPEAHPVRIVAQPVFGDGTTAPLEECPFVELTVERVSGTEGKEFAEVVTGLDAVVPTPAYAVNGEGQKVLRVNVSWQNPSDVRFGGAVLFVIWYDGVHYQLGGLGTGTVFNWETPYFPSSTQSATFYVLSVDKANRRNTYAAGVTPVKTINIPAPELGAAGVEYTSHVTNFQAVVGYNSATADGTVPAVITATFTPPSDPTWGGLEIVTYDGYYYTARVRVRSSPAIVTVPTPSSSQPWYVYGVSFDVNGRRNTIAAGTPYALVYLGTAAGTLRLNKFDPDTVELTQFVLYNNKLKIFQIDGDLIVSGTVSSAKLNATAINVGGGGSKPGKFGVYSAAGAQIGFIGVEDGVEGGWFKTLGVGGANKSNPRLYADTDGNLSMVDGSVTVNGTGFSVAINTTAGIKVTHSGLGIYTQIKNYGVILATTEDAYRVAVTDGAAGGDVTVYNLAGNYVRLNNSAVWIGTNAVIDAGRNLRNIVDVEMTGWIYIDSVATLKGQGSAVANPSGGGTQDAECRAQLIALLGQLRTIGIIAT